MLGKQTCPSSEAALDDSNVLNYFLFGNGACDTRELYAIVKVSHVKNLLLK